MFLKQSTAATIKVGPFLDSTDGDTEETALTIAQADIRLTKNGGNYAQTNNVAGATHDENAEYDVPLDTTDTDTLGRLKVFIHVAGALAVWNEFMILPANVFDALVADTDTLQVDLLQMGGVAQSATDLKDFADEGYDPATDKVQGLVLADEVTTLTGHTPQTGDSFARLGAPAAASIAADLVVIDNFVDDLESRLTAARATNLDELGAINIPADIDTLLARLTAARAALLDEITAARLAELDAANLPADIDSILVDTGEIGAAGAGLTGIPWNAAWDAEVESEVNDALDTAISELAQAAPTATPNLRTGLMLLYMALRDRLDIDTGGASDFKEIYNNAGVVIAKKTLTDDGTVYSEAEMISGP